MPNYGKLCFLLSGTISVLASFPYVFLILIIWGNGLLEEKQRKQSPEVLVLLHHLD